MTPKRSAWCSLKRQAAAGPPRVPLDSLEATLSCLLVCLPLPGSSFGLAEFRALQLWDWGARFQAGCQVGPISARIGYPPPCLVALSISKPARGYPDRLRCLRIGKQPPTTVAQAESLAIFLNSSSPTPQVCLTLSPRTYQVYPFSPNSASLLWPQSPSRATWYYAAA